jgi:Fibronectin type III domain
LLRGVLCLEAAFCGAQSLMLIFNLNSFNSFFMKNLMLFFFLVGFGVSGVCKNSFVVDTCRAPSYFWSNCDDTSAYLQWYPVSGLPNGGLPRYEVSWRIRNANVGWTVLPVDTGTIRRIGRLSPCVEYDFRVRTVCSASSMSDYSSVGRFKTTGCVVPCSAPGNIQVYSQGNGAGLVWTGISGVSRYEVQYKRANDSVWGHDTAVGRTGVSLVGLMGCTNYRFRIRSVCANGSYSDYSSSVGVLTDGCPVGACVAPTNIHFNLIGNSYVRFNWDSVGVASGYVVEWKSARDSSWTRSTNSQNQGFCWIILNGLSDCTDYSARVKKICSNGQGSDWSAVTGFRTTGCASSSCETPTGVRFGVDAISNSVTFYWDTLAGFTGGYLIQYRIVGSGTWTNSNGYATGMTISYLTPCTNYEFRIQRICGLNTASPFSPIANFHSGCVNSCTLVLSHSVTRDSANIFWTGPISNSAMVTISYRKRGDLTWINTVSLNLSSYIRVGGLLPCTDYEVQGVMNCAGIAGPTARDSFRTLGVGCADSCSVPTGVRFVVNAVSNSATFYWDSVSTTGNSYVVQYSVVGSNSWTSGYGSGSGMSINNLIPCTNYYFRVERICSGNTASQFTPIASFTSGCNGTGCNLVLSHYAGRDSATIYWTGQLANSGGISILYRRLGDTGWVNVLSNIINGGIRVGGLLPCSNYEVLGRLTCGGVVSTARDSFRTLGVNCFGGGSGGGLGFVRDFNVFPNPGREQIEVDYILDAEARIGLELVNLQGKTIQTLDLGTLGVGRYAQKMEGLSDLSSGLYLVVLRADGRVAVARKWMKN